MACQTRRQRQGSRYSRSGTKQRRRRRSMHAEERVARWWSNERSRAGVAELVVAGVEHGSAGLTLVRIFDAPPAACLRTVTVAVRVPTRRLASTHSERRASPIDHRREKRKTSDRRTLQWRALERYGDRCCSVSHSLRWASTPATDEACAPNPRAI